MPDVHEDSSTVTAPDALRRRTMLTGLAAAGVGVPLLAACSDDSETADDPGADAASDSPSEAASSDDSGAATALAATADVAVGSAVFVEEPSVVVTQPAEGEFHAFERACTHQGCPVVDIVDGNIHCDCHGSLFSMTDGSVVQGPATQPLAEFAITVDGDQILPA